MPDKPLTANTQDLANTEYDAERWAHVGAERQSTPPLSPKASSGRAERAEADLTQQERDAGQRAGRKRLSEDGLPQTPLTPEQQEAANRTKTTVRDSLKRGSQKTERAMSGD